MTNQLQAIMALSKETLEETQYRLLHEHTIKVMDEVVLALKTHNYPAALELMKKLKDGQGVVDFNYTDDDKVMTIMEITGQLIDLKSVLPDNSEVLKGDAEEKPKKAPKKKTPKKDKPDPEPEVEEVPEETAEEVVEEAVELPAEEQEQTEDIVSEETVETESEVEKASEKNEAVETIESDNKVDSTEDATEKSDDTDEDPFEDMFS